MENQSEGGSEDGIEKGPIWATTQTGPSINQLRIQRELEISRPPGRSRADSRVRRSRRQARTLIVVEGGMRSRGRSRGRSRRRFNRRGAARIAAIVFVAQLAEAIFQLAAEVM